MMFEIDNYYYHHHHYSCSKKITIITQTHTYTNDHIIDDDDDDHKVYFNLLIIIIIIIIVEYIKWNRNQWNGKQQQQQQPTKPKQNQWINDLSLLLLLWNGQNVGVFSLQIDIWTNFFYRKFFFCFLTQYQYSLAWWWWWWSVSLLIAHKESSYVCVCINWTKDCHCVLLVFFFLVKHKKQNHLQVWNH